MAVTRATFARSVTYTVTERPDPAAAPLFDTRHGNRRRASHSDLLRSRPSRARRGWAVGDRPDAVDWIECGQCRVVMSVVPSATKNLHYFVCPKCKARFASNYEEVLWAGAGVRSRSGDRGERSEDRDRWHNLKARAEAFHQRIDDSDPYLVLGVSRATPFGEVRAQYHELAARHHPDHGGDPAEMRRIIHAYERVRRLMARAAGEAGLGSPYEHDRVR